MDDRGRRQPERREPVEHLLEILDRPEVKTQEITVLTCDPVALTDLGRVPGDLRNALQLARRRANANHRRDRVSDGCRVDICVVPTDRAGTLEALDTFRDGGRREADPAPELSHAHAALGSQLTEDAQVDLVEKIRCVGFCVSRPCLSRQSAPNSVDRPFHYGTREPTMSR